jgi:hypothetical protein
LFTIAEIYVPTTSTLIVEDESPVYISVKSLRFTYRCSSVPSPSLALITKSIYLSVALIPCADNESSTATFTLALFTKKSFGIFIVLISLPPCFMVYDLRISFVPSASSIVIANDVSNAGIVTVLNVATLSVTADKSPLNTKSAAARAAISALIFIRRSSVVPP